MRMETDRELMERMKRGDNDALGMLILRWREKGEAYAYRMLRDRQLAEDAVLEAFARIHASRETCDTRYAFSTYLYVVIRRVCIDELRRLRRAPLLRADDMPEPFVDSAEAEYMARWERTGRMQRIAELNERDRRLLLEFALEGKSTRELARENGMTDGQVRIRLHRIRKRLKKEEGDAE